eukprot:TRINITY_DN13164_c2_g2_i1.p1 TRINITY_DN13164_c2_g2~~TRINITY_DN13164_c2_g2_i1.p1  ORF type:complete len:130 (-),score=20.97 TRINITY_DN13164_c2_g2_i1:13-402(-)
MTWMMVSRFFCRLLLFLSQCVTATLPPSTWRRISQPGMSSSAEAFSGVEIGVAENNTIKSSSNIKIVRRIIITNDSSDPPGTINSSSSSSFSSSLLGTHQNNNVDKHQRRTLIISTRGAAEGAANSTHQ